MFSTMDIRLGLAPQTDKLTAPTSGNLFMLDYIPGSLMTVDVTTIESQTLKPKRAGAGTRRGRQEVKGSFKVRMRASKAIDYMLASVASGEWTEAGAAGEEGDTLTAGTKNVYLMIVQEYTDDTGAVIHDNFIGCIVTKFSFSAENNVGIEATVEFVGLKAEDDINNASALTKVESDEGLELIGDDVTDIVVDGAEIDEYTKLDVSIEQPRDPKYILGQSHAIAASASAPRKVVSTLNYFRTVGNTGFTGANQHFGFKLGDVYAFDFASVYASYPAHQYGGSDVESMVTLTAGYNKTAATDMKITR